MLLSAFYPGLALLQIPIGPALHFAFSCPLPTQPTWPLRSGRAKQHSDSPSRGQGGEGREERRGAWGGGARHAIVGRQKRRRRRGERASVLSPPHPHCRHAPAAPSSRRSNGQPRSLVSRSGAGAAGRRQGLAHRQHARLRWDARLAAGGRPCRTGRRRRGCHLADTPSPSLLKRLPKGEAGAAG